MKNVLITLIVLFSASCIQAQDCITRGQTPSSAFPVCGTSIFQQTTVPICVTQSLVVPGCGGDGAAYADKNPYWYKFTCYESGSLGFLIKPLDQGDDYDWQLYDITDRDPNDVFTDASLVVTGNWAGTYGNTGASASGVNFIQCASDPAAGKNSFAKMPMIVKGHTYLLLVSHYTNSQSGYNLSFGGGTAVITDPTLPSLKTAEAACSGNLVRIKLGKKIRCSSIASNGSDFLINAPGVSIASASSVACSGGFDTDEIALTLNGSLSPGTYQVSMKKGNDNNTLLDHCDNPIPENDVVSFTVLPLAPTPMDSLAPVECATSQLKLVFKKPIDCSSIASDGSDFVVNGTYAVSVINAGGTCSSGTTQEIILNFSQPLETKGDFVVTLRRGSDGNTLIDECAQETPAGSSLPFSVKDVVDASFTYDLRYGCTIDTVHFFHPGGKEINSWQWKLDEGKTSTSQNPEARYTIFNQKNIELIVSNGFCSDTAQSVVNLDNFLNADFAVVPDNCPLEPVQFTSNAVGKIAAHHWTFGDGANSAEETPKHVYQQPSTERSFQVRYTVTDSLGCQKSIAKPIRIYSSCTIYIPNAFTPGNDGRNDIFRVLNAVKADNFEWRIYNRWGQLVFQTKDWKQGWDGKLKGQLQPAGAYVWMLRYADSRNGQKVERKGSFVLIR